MTVHSTANVAAVIATQAIWPAFPAQEHRPPAGAPARLAERVVGFRVAISRTAVLIKTE